MSENKTKPTSVSVQAFLSGVEDPARRADCDTLIELMKRVTGAEPVMWGPSIIGFGSYSYHYESGHKGESAVTGFSPRAREFSIYLTAPGPDQEELLAKLGKHKMGKSCLYVKKLSDIDLEVLQKLVEQSVSAVKKLYDPERSGAI